MNENVSVEIITGIAKKSGNEYTAIKLTIGDWSQLVFPRSSFEMDYIRQQLED